MEASQLEQLMKFLLETLQQSKDFTVSEAPQFVRELLMWKFWSAAVWMGGFVSVCGIAWVVLPKAAGVIFPESYEDDIRRGLATFGRTITAIVATLAIAINAAEMIKVKVAPRVVLVDMVRSMIASR